MLRWLRGQCLWLLRDVGVESGEGADRVVPVRTLIVGQGWISRRRQFQRRVGAARWLSACGCVRR